MDEKVKIVQNDMTEIKALLQELISICQSIEQKITPENISVLV